MLFTCLSGHSHLAKSKGATELIGNSNTIVLEVNTLQKTPPLKDCLPFMITYKK